MKGAVINPGLKRLDLLNRPLPPEGILEYLLVISLPESVFEEIMQLKKQFAKKYAHPLAVQSKPHITLVRFMSPATVQRQLLHQLLNITATLAPISIQLDGYNNFPAHTIYLKLLQREAVRNIVTHLKAARKWMRVPDYAPHFIDEPHLTIARKLDQHQYAAAWKEFSHLSFKALFIASDLLLMQRPADGRKHAYQFTAKLPLKNQPSANGRQIDLFS